MVLEEGESAHLREIRLLLGLRGLRGSEGSCLVELLAGEQMRRLERRAEPLRSPAAMAREYQM